MSAVPIAKYSKLKLVINFVYLTTYMIEFWKTYQLHTSEIIRISIFATL